MGGRLSRMILNHIFNDVGLDAFLFTVVTCSLMSGIIYMDKILRK